MWRKVLKSIRSRSEIRRHEILSHLHRPPTAHKLTEVLMAIEKWDGTHREYVEAGGQPLPFEERRASLLQILPPSFRQDAFFRIPAMQESHMGVSPDQQEMAYQNLKSALQRQVELSVQWPTIGQRDQQANVLGGESHEEGSGEPVPDKVYWDDAYLCYVRKGKGKGKGKDRGDKGKGKTAKCHNCGSTGHMQAACPKPQVPWNERPCHNCGGKGHLSSSCPQRKAGKGTGKAAHSVEGEVPPVHTMLLMKEDEDVMSAKICDFSRGPEAKTRLKRHASFARASEPGPISTRNRFACLADEDGGSWQPVTSRRTRHRTTRNAERHARATVLTVLATTPRRVASRGGAGPSHQQRCGGILQTRRYDPETPQNDGRLGGIFGWAGAAS